MDDRILLRLRSVLLFLFAIDIVCSDFNSKFINKFPIFTEEWNLYKVRYELKFNDTEDEIRSKIFSRNLLYIEEFNNRKGMHFKLQMNHFGHLSDEEYISSLVLITNNSTNEVGRPRLRNIAPVPDVDYRIRGIIPPVRDQGSCQCSWAFSAVDVLESQIFFRSKTKRKLSEQQLIDCSESEGNRGCQGGNPEWAFRYIQKNGLNLESEYPFIGREVGRCQPQKNKSEKFILKRIRRVPSGSEFFLQWHLLTNGPLSIALDASERSFRFYGSGVYHSSFCSNTDLNHALTLVGMKDPFNGYYIIKNSWGTDWGLGGYIHLAKNKYNMCGVATQAVFPQISMVQDVKEEVFDV